MKYIIVACFVFVLLFAGSLAKNKGEKKKEEAVTGTVWAVLVAGSSGWNNYRHFCWIERFKCEGIKLMCVTPTRYYTTMESLMTT